MNPFEGKVSIVTGGWAGIGRALCEELSHRGSTVIIADVNDSGAKQAAAIITQRDEQAHAVHVDVTKEADVKRLIEETASQYGHLDYIFNNAGIAIGDEARDLSLSPAS